MNNEKYSNAFPNFKATNNQDKALELTKKSFQTFSEKFANLETGDRNRVLMREISGTVASLNKNTFLKKFNSTDLDNKHFLKLSNTFVSRKKD